MQASDFSPEIQSVSQLNRRVSRALQEHFGLQQVRGEISAFTRASSGHWYFTLKDDGAQVRCVMFRGRQTHLDFSPREGDEVVATANISLYEPRGDFQLNVESLRRHGAGRLWEQFLRLRQRLADEGLFDLTRKRQLPRVPRRIGIVTSLKAAALRDVITTLRRRAPYAGLIVYPVPVQGADAGERIARMLALAGARAEVDVVLLVRGGGSIEDLWAFNEEVVARALRACPLPVVVGVGHESDVTIADFAADVRAATPTAAAELVAPALESLRLGVEQPWRRLARAWRSSQDQRLQRLDHARRLLASPRGALQGLQGRVSALVARCRREANATRLRGASELQAATRLLERGLPDVAVLRRTHEDLRARLTRSAHRNLARQQDKLAGMQRALFQLDTQRVLERGFAIVRDQQGLVLRAAAGLQPGAELNARLAQGSLHVRVMGIDDAPPRESIESLSEPDPAA